MESLEDLDNLEETQKSTWKKVRKIPIKGLFYFMNNLGEKDLDQEIRDYPLKNGGYLLYQIIASPVIAGLTVGGLCVLAKEIL